MEDNQQTSQNQEKKTSYTGWIITAIIIFGATLPFHYLPDHLMVFPKDHLTLSNTYISQDDVDKLIERYNNASFFEKQAIRQEPLVRKLVEKGIIVKNDKPNEDGNSEE